MITLTPEQRQKEREFLTTISNDIADYYLEHDTDKEQTSEIELAMFFCSKYTDLDHLHYIILGSLLNHFSTKEGHFELTLVIAQRKIEKHLKDDTGV